MIKRTPQEIADLFGCYLVKDSDGDWFGFLERPIHNHYTWYVPNNNNSFCISIEESLIDWQGDWNDSLHEPQKMHDKCTINAPVQLDNLDNKVCDYYIVHKYDIKSMLDKGWELYGNPFAIEGAVYQAMIRR